MYVVNMFCNIVFNEKTIYLYSLIYEAKVMLCLKILGAFGGRRNNVFFFCVRRCLSLKQTNLMLFERGVHQ